MCSHHQRIDQSIDTIDGDLIEPPMIANKSSLSSDARCNTPRRFGIGRIETSGSVAMRGYSHLSDDEREQIGLLKVLGHSIGAIARALRRPKSTISRELSRNRLPSGRYSPLHAAGAYQLRRRREALIEKDRALRSFVLDRLAEGWTPEQIAGWLKAGNERRLRAVGCETIYAFIYRAAQKAEQLWRYLTRRHKRRRPRRSRPSRDIPRSRHDPKILWVDDAEIVGDQITKVRPIPRNLFTQKTERRIGELGASCVALVVSDVSVHEAP